MDGIGANEYIVDVTHGMCDFISTVDTPSVWELNIWYHTLNCGYRCRISGETDFPCIYGERVGLGRSYVHLDGKLDFDAWVEGIKRRPLLRQRRQEPSDGFHRQRPRRRREEKRSQARGAGDGRDQGEGGGACWSRSRRRDGSIAEDADKAPAIKRCRNRTGISNVPASATRARFRSRSWSMAARSPARRSSPTARSKR